MKKNRISIVILIGFLAILGILVLQGLWLKKAFASEQSRLDEDIHIALLEVVKQLYQDQPLPQNNPIKRVSANYYAVNTEAEIDAKLLEYFLKVELGRRHVNLDFEYAIYNCEDDEMVYGNYVSMNGEADRKVDYFPALNDYVYYFAIRFPERTTFVASSLMEWIALTCLLVVVLGIYVYSVISLLRERRFADMQRDFINTMAHEFKTPLSSIQLAATHLSEQSSLLEDERSAMYSKVLLESAGRLNSEVERILELGRVEAQSLPLHKVDVPLKNIASDVIQGLKLTYSSTQFHEDLPSDFSLYADESHLKNVLFNVLENAAKYGGKEVRIQLSSNGKSLRIFDSGVGIPKPLQKRVFGKFIRYSAESDLKGHGLGLYYVRQVVEAHGWKIGMNKLEPTGFEVYIDF